ncbi:DNA polymerase III subunit delta' [Corynebacterium atypicum]|uniref:DNA polymerase III subunit delta n=2 Tax=Corynebacterium atypicum TaxID=191610 RepID=A0ABM5QLA7_9CORY|nr:DNA polymerase III subunit delta' [Corynebacterium atypicum]
MPADSGPVFAALADAPRVRDLVSAAAWAARSQVGGVPPGRGAPGASIVDAGRSMGTDAAMTHSWLITGAPGSGRTEVARAFAAALECTDPQRPGCGQCAACQAVLARAHTDVVEIAPEGLSISVETVREEIVGRAETLPTVGSWRVVIVHDADRLSPAAADALLKTVEEPAPRTVLFFCAPSTDPEDFSVTLRSRCRHIYVPPPSVDRIVRILTSEEGASEPDARLAALASLRHIGRARRLVTRPEMQRRRARVLRLAELIGHGDVAFREAGQLFQAIKSETADDFADADAEEKAVLERSLGMGGRGKGVQKSLRGSAGAVRDLEKQQKRRKTRRERDLLDLSLVDLTGLYRDAFLLSCGARLAPTHPDFQGLAQELATSVSPQGLVACLDAIALCRRHITQNVGLSIAVDGMIGRLRLAYGVR